MTTTDQTLSRNDSDELIASGASLSRLRQNFSSKEATLLYYAQFQTAKFSIPSPPECCMCNRHSDIVARYNWKAVFSTRFSPSIVDVLLLFLGFIRIRTKSKVITFSTFHSFCNGCWRKMFLRRSLANVIHFFALLSAVIMLFLTPMTWAMYLYFRTDRTWEKDIPSMLLSAIFSTFGLAFCVYVLFSLTKLRVPLAIRTIPRRPFGYQNASKENLQTGFPVEQTNA